MEIRSESITLKVDDNSTMQAWTARPSAAGRFPGLLVLQEAFGVNAHIRDLTERFAREGFVAIAPELFHRTAPGFDGRYDDFPSTMPHLRALNDPNMEADLRAAHSRLIANGVAENQLQQSAIAWADAPHFSPRSPCRLFAAFPTTAEESLPAQPIPD